MSLPVNEYATPLSSQLNDKKQSVLMSPLRKTFVFKGRASRREYWGFYGLFILFYLIIAITTVALADMLSLAAQILMFVIGLVFLILIITTTSLTVRRLHDINKSGWGYFINLIPIVGPLIFLVWTLKRGTQGDNRFGADPYAGSN